MMIKIDVNTSKLIVELVFSDTVSAKITRTRCKNLVLVWTFICIKERFHISCKPLAAKNVL